MDLSCPFASSTKDTGYKQSICYVLWFPECPFVPESRHFPVMDTLLRTYAAQRTIVAMQKDCVCRIQGRHGTISATGARIRNAHIYKYKIQLLFNSNMIFKPIILMICL